MNILTSECVIAGQIWKAKWCKIQEKYCNHNQHFRSHSTDQFDINQHLRSRSTKYNHHVQHQEWHSTEFYQAMWKSRKSGFKECKSVRFKGLERESHSRGEKFDQQRRRKMSTNPIKPAGLDEVHLGNRPVSHEVSKWRLVVLAASKNK